MLANFVKSVNFGISNNKEGIYRVGGRVTRAVGSDTFLDEGRGCE